MENIYNLIASGNLVREEKGVRIFHDDYTRLIFEYDLLVDGTRGGLVIGKSHAEGGIYLVTATPDQKHLCLIGEIEGWEYILNPFATHYYNDNIEEIDSNYPDKEAEFQLYLIPDGVTVIDASPIKIGFSMVDRLVYFGGNFQRVINRNVTKDNLDFFEKINTQAWENYGPKE